MTVARTGKRRQAKGFTRNRKAAVIFMQISERDYRTILLWFKKLRPKNATFVTMNQRGETCKVFFW
jgi:hypothetical protein